MSTELKYDGKPSQSKFIRDKLKVGFRKPRSRKPRWMGNIEVGVSHFLCPEHIVWLPNHRYDVTLDDKRQIQKEIANDWREGLLDGTYRNKADIAKRIGCSRAWVTRLLNREFAFAP